MHTKSLQLCPTLCDPMDHSIPGSSVHEDSLGKNTGVGCHTLFQEILPDQGTELRSLTSASQAGSLPSELPGTLPALAGGFFTTSVGKPDFMDTRIQMAQK